VKRTRAAPTRPEAALTEPEELHKVERCEQKNCGHENQRNPDQDSMNRPQKLHSLNSPSYESIPQKIIARDSSKLW
jgi:hypothetical protein